MVSFVNGHPVSQRKKEKYWLTLCNDVPETETPNIFSEMLCGERERGSCVSSFLAHAQHKSIEQPKHSHQV